MSFVSLSYLIFLPVTALIGYVVPARLRYVWLLVMSLAFYAAAGWQYVPVLAACMIVTYAGGRLLDRKTPQTHTAAPQLPESDPGKAAGESEVSANAAVAKEQPHSGEKQVSAGETRRKSPASSRRAILLVCVDIQAGMLFVLKYLGMFVPAARGKIIAPLGISYFLLMGISYLADVCRGKYPAERNFGLLALYVSFFPVISSGPIERADHMIPQFKHPGKFSADKVRDGMLILLWGYFLKLVVSDRLGLFIDTVWADPAAFGGTITVLAAMSFAFEVYCDFMGYSFIAMGSAKILGFDVMENFRSPFLSASMAEFWHKWHISLSLWLRDYIYISLGGNRKGRARKFLNILVTFFVSGLWHGADWTFVFWGLLNGSYQVIGNLLKPIRNFLVRVLKISRQSIGHRIYHALTTYALYAFSMIFFRAENFADAARIFGAMKGFQPWVFTDGTLLSVMGNPMDGRLLLIGIVLVVVTDITRAHGICIREHVARQWIGTRWAITIGAVLFILVFGMWGPGYNANSFIYAQF